MLPPKKSLGTGTQLHVVAGVRRQQRAQHRGAVGAGEHGDGARCRVPAGAALGAAAPGSPRPGAASTEAKKPWRTPPGPPAAGRAKESTKARAMPIPFSCWGNPS